MARKELLHKQDKTKKRIIALVMTLVAGVSIAIYFLFIPSGNVALRSVMNDKETPLDAIARSKAIDNFENNDDFISQKISEILTYNSIPELINKTNNEKDTVLFLKKELELDDSIANDISEEIFTNKSLITIHENIKRSEWKKAYENFNTLKNSGELNAIINNLSHENISEAQKLQNEASEILNKE